MRKPTPQAYEELQTAFDHFNRSIFESRLPPCLITLQREKRTYGYFSRGRFGDVSGEVTDEIAMNPSYFAVRPVKETLSTLAHEMVHAEQFHFGKPGRRGYHNIEWADRMEAIGLMPSNTGKPGGKRVGEQMTHYVIEGGKFDRACDALLSESFRLSWFDRFPPVDPSSIESLSVEVAGLLELPGLMAANKSNRAKYRCPRCKAQAWGKPGLAIRCGGEDCGNADFIEVV